jgi:alcohol dehydrogenase (cytochrome c)
MRHKALVVMVLGVVGVLGAGTVYAHWDGATALFGMAVNTVRSWSAPAGTTSTETAPRGAGEVTDLPPAAAVPALPAAVDDDWAGYNKSLTSERFSPLAQIDTTNVGRLKVLCTFDTQQHTSFETGLIMVDGALIGTTEQDIFSLNPDDCRLNWRTHEQYVPANPLAVNRGAAYMDGRLFRGTQDGRVLAYDATTGKRLWETVIADPKSGETTPAAPIAWKGLVFIGNAGGDNKGVKGRMYALDAATGSIVWEFFLVPKGPGDVARGPLGASPLSDATWRNDPATPITGGATWTSYSLDPLTGQLYVPGGNPAPDFAPAARPGENLYSGSVVVLDALTGAYQRHFKLVAKDWHDWDVSTAPALIHTRGGRHLLSVAPKDGHLYGFDLATSQLLYRTPVTRIDNAETAFIVHKAVHFCPGAQGGAEWNGPAYDPANNLIFIGEVDWCTTVKLANDRQIAAVKTAHPWSANATHNPYDTYGKQDPYGSWAGWVYAVDADTGAWKWRLKSNFPVMSGMTPTAGGLVFFGDMGGNFYALDARSGRRLWGQKIGGAIGGGVITYGVAGRQRIAIASGFTSILWPTQVVTAKVLIMGLAP